MKEPKWKRKMLQVRYACLQVTKIMSIGLESQDLRPKDLVRFHSMILLGKFFCMSNSEIDSLSESTNSFMPGGSCFDDIFYDHPYVVSMCACSTMEKWQLYMQKAQENIDNKVYLKKKIFYFEKKRKHFTSFQREKISWKKRFHVCSICAYINISESDMSCNTVPVWFTLQKSWALSTKMTLKDLAKADIYLPAPFLALCKNCCSFKEN